MPQTNRLEQSWPLFLLILLAFVLVLTIILTWVQVAWAPTLLGAEEEERLTATGISGDIFGFANSIFSASAFAAFIVTVWMQKHELKQQREELEMTRGVLEKQQEEMANQNESLGRQRFENTFFRMLELHENIVSGIEMTNRGVAGRTALASLVGTLFNQITAKQKNKNISFVDMTEIYDNWYIAYESRIGHYFRTLYNIIRYVDEFGGDDRLVYSRLVRAQLSSHELQLLLFNCLGEHGKKKFKPLVEKYALLKHVSKSDFNQELIELYDSSAFGDPEGSGNE